MAMLVACFSFFTVPSTTGTYTLSLHDALPIFGGHILRRAGDDAGLRHLHVVGRAGQAEVGDLDALEDRKSTRLNSSHVEISYAVFCLKKKKQRRCTYRRIGDVASTDQCILHNA